MPDQTATFRLQFEGNAKDEAFALSAEMEKLRARIEQGQGAIKAYNSNIKAMKGSSDALVAAKNNLKSKVDAERDSISKDRLDLLRLGASYETCAAKVKHLAREEANRIKLKEAENLKKSTEAQNRLSAAIRMGGGPVSSLAGKAKELNGVLGGSGGAMAGVALGAAAIVTGVIAVTSTIAGATEAMGRFLWQSALSTRQQYQFARASTISGDSAKNMIKGLDYFSKMLPQSREELAGLQADITMAIRGSRLGGEARAVSNLFALTASTAAVYGDKVSSKMRSVFEGMKDEMWGYSRISRQALEGTPFAKSFNEIAAMAKKAGININLVANGMGEQGLMGKTKDLLAAFRMFNDQSQTTRETLSSAMKDPYVLWTKFTDKLGQFGRSLKIEPVLLALSKLVDGFDVSTSEGKAFGETLSRAMNSSMPTIIAGIEWIGASIPSLIRSVGAFVSSIGSMAKFVSDHWGTIKLAIMAIGVSVVAIGAVFVLVGGIIAASLALVGAAIFAVGTAGYGVMSVIWNLGSSIVSAYNFIAGLKWSDIGRAIVDGIGSGIRNFGASLIQDVKDLGSGIMNAFRGMLGIHSPSRVFAEYGLNITAGLAQGIHSGAPQAREAVEQMAPMPPPASMGNGVNRNSSNVFNITIQVPTTGSGKETADALTSPSLREALVRFLEQAAIESGLSIGTVVPQ